MKLLVFRRGAKQATELLATGVPRQQGKKRYWSRVRRLGFSLQGERQPGQIEKSSGILQRKGTCLPLVPPRSETGGLARLLRLLITIDRNFET